MVGLLVKICYEGLEGEATLAVEVSQPPLLKLIPARVLEATGRSLLAGILLGINPTLVLIPFAVLFALLVNQLVSRSGLPADALLNIVGPVVGGFVLAAAGFAAGAALS
jgi:branched-subunit amino acid transport protein